MVVELPPEVGEEINKLIAPYTQAWEGYRIVEIIINPSSFPVNDPDHIVINARIEARRKQSSGMTGG